MWEGKNNFILVRILLFNEPTVVCVVRIVPLLSIAVISAGFLKVWTKTRLVLPNLQLLVFTYGLHYNLFDPFFLETRSKKSDPVLIVASLTTGNADKLCLEAVSWNDKCWAVIQSTYLYAHSNSHHCFLGSAQSVSTGTSSSSTVTLPPA